jgi:hypothetical protein
VFGIRKNYHSSGKVLLLYQSTRRAIELAVVIFKACHCYQLHTKFSSNNLFSRLSSYEEEITWDH